MINKKRPIYIAAIILSTAIYVTLAVNQQRKIEMDRVAITEKTEQSNETAQLSEVNNTKESNNKVKIYQHTIKPTDTLKNIASTYNVSMDTIAKSNGISKDTELKEGQILEFPSITGVIYKVKDGETLWDLASLNKIDVNKIVEVNKLESPDKLKLDQKIIIPDIVEVKSVDFKNNGSLNNKNTDTADAAESSKKIVASSKTLSRGTSTSSVSGSLPVSGKITSMYGPRWGRQHEGIDIAAPTGTNVYAFMDGKVTFSGWDGGYGKLVIIDHGNGFKSYYAHNSELLVKSGQQVKKGTHIAEVGNTGNSTGSHSHFEIRKNDNPVNPLNYVK